MKIAITFTGQGSQHLNMGNDFAMHFPFLKNTIEQANQAFGEDLWHIISHDQNTLNQTQYAQPGILLVEAMILQAFQDKFSSPPIALFAGHSLGEYTALFASGSIDFKSAISLVANRGTMMQKACSNGKMAAVLRAEPSMLQTLCQQISANPLTQVQTACINAPDQIVISGNTQGVEKAQAQLAEHNIKTVTLPVSVPSHCQLMKPAATQFSKLITTQPINDPHTPIIANADAKIKTTASAITHSLIEQFCKPVQWVKTIECMIKKDIDTLIEIGPKPILTALNKKINKQHPHIQHIAINTVEQLHQLNLKH